MQSVKGEAMSEGAPAKLEEVLERATSNQDRLFSEADLGKVMSKNKPKRENRGEKSKKRLRSADLDERGGFQPVEEQEVEGCWEKKLRGPRRGRRPIREADKESELGL